MSYPSLKPRPEFVEKARVNETGDFGLHDTLREGFTSVRGDLCKPHDLELSQKNFRKNADKMNLAFLQSCQGIHAPLKIMFERNACKKAQRLPFLPSSNILLETLEGRDETIDYDDYVFTDPFEGVESLATPHMVMEKYLFSSKEQ